MKRTASRQTPNLKECSMNREDLAELSYDCVLPSSIFFNDNLEPNCIKLYAIVRGLTKLHGYCFATNEYLAKILDVEDRSIRRWIQHLKNEGYLEIHRQKKGIQEQRHLYISDGFKKFLRRDKIVHPPGQNCPPPPDKIVHHINKENMKEEEYSMGRESSPPAQKYSPLLEKGKFVRISSEEFEELCKEHGIAVIEKFIEQINDYLAAHGKKPYKDYSATIRNWIRKDQKWDEHSKGNSWKTKSKNSPTYRTNANQSNLNSSEKDSLGPLLPDSNLKILLS